MSTLKRQLAIHAPLLQLAAGAFNFNFPPPVCGARPGFAGTHRR
jgi:hypothetical protein